MLDRIQKALASIKPEGTFATALACGSEDLKIEVKGVGVLRFPISAAMAAKLHAAARPAPFGRRDQTLYDASVRDTGQLGRSRIKIDSRSWKPTLDAQLQSLKRYLGLPEEGRLDAILDKMLVYGPGQFFAQHQDSERADDMLGSLVVTLPSEYKGGETIVEHNGEHKVFRGPKRDRNELSLLAFYADCRHEVKPVKSGYRIALTYQLHYRGATRPNVPLGLSARLDRLSTSISAYFSTPAADGEPPEQLIYLLDHEYTQKSLAWNRLKNGDRLRAAALLHAADKMACEIHLALADVHECWSCEEQEWGGGYGFGRRYGRGSWRDGWSDDEDDDEDDDDGGGGADLEDYELQELLHWDFELRHWIDKAGRTARGLVATAGNREVCHTRPSVEMEPFKSEHEGYMGNYGNTVDRWYHRAAVVMWPTDRDFVVRARMSPAWAMKELAALLKRGAVSEARDKASRLLPFWKAAGPKEPSAAFFLKLLQVAALLSDGELAHDLLGPFGPDRLDPGSLPGFVSLVTRYGLSWSQQIFGTWSEHRRYPTPAWIEHLPQLCEQLWATRTATGRTLAGWLLEREEALFEQRQKAAREAPPMRLVAGKPTPRYEDLLALLDSVATISAGAIRSRLVAFLMAPATGLPLMSAGELLMECRKGRPSAAVRALGLQSLYEQVVAGLQRSLAAPVRSPDDWSIEVSLHCKCELCSVLSAFLRDPRRIEYPWPLAKGGRQHIHSMLDSSDLLVAHVTTRRGSPYVLVLTKKKELFAREDALRKRQQTLLGWLKRQASAFAAVSATSPEVPSTP